MLTCMMAVGPNGLIGNGDGLPWRCAPDLKNFSKVTKELNQPLLAGHNTFVSLEGKLPHRELIALPRRHDETVDLLSQYNMHPEQHAVFIGGGKSLERYYEFVDEWYLTYIPESYLTPDRDIRQDVYLPSTPKRLIEGEFAGFDIDFTRVTRLHRIGNRTDIAYLD